VLVSCTSLAITPLSKTPFLNQPKIKSSLIEGKHFIHQTYLKPGLGGVLHIYIEGDGRPWLTDTKVALDPTPTYHLMAHLMMLDTAPSVYLGRPCYFQTQDIACQNSIWWTHQRYAPEVLASMNAVIDHYAKNYESIRLFGHSGGGTLAMLLAQRRHDVDAIMTIAPNLAIDDWAKFHDYTPLKGSLNPVDYPVPTDLTQYHYVGTEDQVVPTELVQRVLAKMGASPAYEIEGFDHLCCWRKLWPELLDHFK